MVDKNLIKVILILISTTLASFIDFETLVFKDKAKKNAPKHEIVS